MRISTGPKLMLVTPFLVACATRAPEPVRPEPTAVSVASGPAHSQPSPVQEWKVPAVLELVGHGTKDVIVAPDTVRRGAEIRVIITSFGSGCEREAESEVSLSGNTAMVSVYDYSRAPASGPLLRAVCTAEVRRLPRMLTLRFPEAGEARIRARGVRVAPGPRRGRESMVLEKRVVVR